jgi:flagellar FliJ protein
LLYLQAANSPSGSAGEYPMPASKSEKQCRMREFHIDHRRLRATQIETMIADFDRTCANIEQLIQAEETRTRNSDPMHFAYSTVAKAARERRERLQRSANALRAELGRLWSDAGDAAEGELAA